MVMCDSCGKSLGYLQPDLYGGPTKCIACLTAARIDMMIAVLPYEDERTWEDLRPFEQRFLNSIREQFAVKKTLSEKQYQVLERIYEQHN